MTTEEDDDPPPAGPLDQALRETMLRRASPEDGRALVRVAWMLFSYLLEQGKNENSGGMRDALLAASRDVRHLEGFLVKTAEVYRDDGLVATSGRDLAVVARAVARRLGRVAEVMEQELGLRTAKSGDIELDPAVHPEGGSHHPGGPQS